VVSMELQKPLPRSRSRSADSGRGSSFRQRRARRLLGPTLLAPVAICGIAGCTSMPFMPTSGAGGALTLATANHVASREDALRRELLQQVERRIEVMVQTAREQDRARLEEIAEQVESRADEVSELVERLDRNEQALEEIATMLAERLDRLAEETAALREQTATLQDEVGSMPAETLDRLGRAIDTVLREAEREQERAAEEEAAEEEVAPNSRSAAGEGPEASRTAPPAGAEEADGRLLRPPLQSGR